MHRVFSVVVAEARHEIKNELNYQFYAKNEDLKPVVLQESKIRRESKVFEIKVKLHGSFESSQQVWFKGNRRIRR